MNTKRTKSNSISPPARASIWYTVSGVLERGAAFLLTPIFTRILTPDEYGLYPLYVSYMGLFTAIITLELSGGVIYRGLAKFIGREKEFIAAAADIILALGAVALTLSLPLGNMAAALLGLSPRVIRILIIQVSAAGIINLYISKCRHRYDHRTTIAVNLSLAILSPLISILLINFTGLRAEGRIIGQLAVCSAIALPLLLAIYSGAAARFDMYGYILRQAIPLLPHFIAATVTVQSGRIAVGRYFGEDDVAKYAVAFSTGFLLSMLTNGIYAAISPWISRKTSHGCGDKVNDVLPKVFSALASVSIMIPLTAPEIMTVLAPREYADAIAAVYPVCLAVLISFLSSTLGCIIICSEKTRLVTLASVATATASVVLNITVTSRTGYVSAAVIYATSMLVQLGLYMALIVGVMKMRTLNFAPVIKTVLSTAVSYIVLYMLRDVLISRIILLPAVIMIAIPRLLHCRELIGINKGKKI